MVCQGGGRGGECTRAATVRGAPSSRAPLPEKGAAVARVVNSYPKRAPIAKGEREHTGHAGRRGVVESARVLKGGCNAGARARARARCCLAVRCVGAGCGPSELFLGGTRRKAMRCAHGELIKSCSVRPQLLRGWWGEWGSHCGAVVS
eukprot:1181761-Prorocentrum_minimum.AAC.3